MKKIISLFLSFVMLLSVTAGLNLTASAESSGDYEYEVLDNSNTVQILGYKGSSSILEIPSTLDGYEVKEIGDKAFYNNQNLIEVTIPNGVTYISEYAFGGCKNLTTLNCSAGLERIWYRAFTMTALKDVNFNGTEEQWNAIIILNGEDDGNHEIVNAAIHYITAGADSVYSYKMIEGSDAVEITAYTGNEANVVIPSEIDGHPVKAIGKEAFYNNKDLVQVTIPDGVTVVDESAFAFCTNLETVNCTNSIKNINMHAFLGCMALKDVYFDGTADEWNAISIVNGKDEGNCFIIDAAKHYSAGSSCDVTGHNLKVNSAKQASSTEDGYTGDKVCASCGKTIEKGSVIPMVSDVKLSRTEINYTGTVQRPLVTVSDRAGNGLTYKKDFTVDYSDWNSKNVGVYEVTVSFIGNYEGSQTYTYNINAQSNVVPILNRSEIKMTGTVQRPTVTVSDIYGNELTYKKDFTVDYSDWNSTNVGRYTITITMQGNYSGSFTYPYYINPRPVSFLSSAQGGFKGIKNGFTLTWNKQANQTTGYQLQFATKRDFSNAATVWIENPEVTSCTIPGRAANTRYYVRIRPYTQIDNGTFFGDWDYEGSYVKSIVTK